MKFVLAPDSFKESMNAFQCAEAMEKGVRAVFPYARCVQVPMADGGEGTVAAIINSNGGEYFEVNTVDPYGEPIVAKYGWLRTDNTAVIEVAQAVGAHLIPRHERDVWKASSRGLAEVFDAAQKRGASQLIVGLGGSVTNDGGIGLLHALGLRLFDKDENELSPEPTSLSLVSKVDPSALLKWRNIPITIACDVSSPLCGSTGATYTFGPQKGASSKDIPLLDKAISKWADTIERAFNVRVSNIPGAGAAGGLGFALMAALGAKIHTGVEVVMAAMHFEELIADADFVFTGEGSIDSQTSTGKTPWGVACSARKANAIPIGFCGTLEENCPELLDVFAAIFPIVPGPCDLSTAMKNAPQNMTRSVEMVCRIIAQSTQRNRGDDD